MLLTLLAAVQPSPTETVAPTDVTGNVTQEAKNLIEAAIESLPRIGIALVILVVGYGVAVGLRAFARRRLFGGRSESFTRVFSKMIYAAVIVVASLLAVTTVFPSVAPVDVLAGLGVFSIAIGFAFQDILSNLLAGILLLIRQPFEEGDQIEVGGVRGTVQGITIRETQIRTFDGEKVVIPNADVYTGVITVQTAYGPSRTVLGIGFDDWEDFDVATDVILEAVGSVDGVLADPGPEVFFKEFGDSTTNCDVRYWTDPDQATVRSVQDRVVRAIGAGLAEAGISMPSPITELDARASLSGLLRG